LEKLNRAHLFTDVKNIYTNITDKRKAAITLAVVMILLSCFLVMATAAAQSSYPTPPAGFNGGDFSGGPPSDWNGNMSMPDFNGSFPFGNGDRSMPNFNGSMPRPSGSPPSDFNGQISPQVSGNQTNYTLYVLAGVAIVVVVAVISVVAIRKRKPRQPAPIAS
jgi:hypothetical protein